VHQALDLREGARIAAIGSISMSFDEAAVIAPRKSFILCDAT
jgi:hypothetical protein